MASTSELLADHGDRQVPAGALDLAVNVVAQTPSWLREELAELDLASYPDTRAAADAAATRHGVDVDRCLLTNGAAEAFWAVAHGISPRLAVCVHPSFTAPEAALRSAGVPVHRVIRRPEEGFALDPAAVPDEADLVVLGRPDNPTGLMESYEVVGSLVRPGRVVVVDEAFADFLPDGESLVSMGLPGVICVRSMTKLWGLAGLRVGYVLGPPDLLRRLAAALQPWPVSTPAAHAVQRLSVSEPERKARADRVAASRLALLTGMGQVGEDLLKVWPSPANFVLLQTALPHLRERLLEVDIAVRRCETFPGLDSSFARVAVPVEDGPRARFLDELHRLSFAARARIMNS